MLPLWESANIVEQSRCLREQQIVFGQAGLTSQEEDFLAGASGMFLFQDNGLDPSFREFIELGNIFFKPAFEVIQIGVFHDNGINASNMSQAVFVISSPSSSSGQAPRRGELSS